MVELLGRYSNRTDVLDRLSILLHLPDRDAQEAPREPRQRQTRLNESDQRRLVEGYTSGSTVNALAEQFDVARQTVSIILERHGVKRRYRLLGDRELALARRLYEQGRSLADVAEQLQVSSKTVLTGLRAVGVTTRPVGTNQWG